ncbi:MAG: hypothetical protein GY874_10780 [Desulfobacteraceae bacterium]|nr:hypothetical protein [Desulfobacteraceae bacterium]
MDFKRKGHVAKADLELVNQSIGMQCNYLVIGAAVSSKPSRRESACKV